MKSGPALLIVGSLALWAVLAVPANHLFGENSAVMAGAAMLLCLLPGAATLHWAAAVARRDPQMLLLVVLGGTFIRLSCALAGGVALYLLLPTIFTIAFWIWLAVFYTFTIAVEIVVLARLNAPDRQRKE